jgi:hypothetical protein
MVSGFRSSDQVSLKQNPQMTEVAIGVNFVLAF